MTGLQRRLMLGAAAVATILAAVFAPKPDEPVQPSHTSSPHGETMPQPVQAQATLTPLPRRGLKGEPGNLFLVDKPAPALAAAKARPPAPVAPPLPFVYMGKMQENGELTIFLTRQDKPYVVHAGDVLDNQYHVDAIKPPLIELTYLPLKQKQLLSMGEIK